MIDMSETSTLRLFGQYFSVDRNGAAMRGIDDQTSGVRNLSQDTISNHELTSSVFAAIYENDLGYANLKVMASVQEDDISVTRDNDRHNYGDLMLTIPGFPDGATYQRAEFRPETSLVDTTTFEINLVSNEPAMNGKLDWTIGAFYMDHEIENHIRGYLDTNLDGELLYICSYPYADPNNCWASFADGGEFDFISDAYPARESYSVYGQTTYSFSDKSRLISGLRYSKDEVESCVKNFFAAVCDDLNSSSDKITGRVAAEYDLDDDTMVYFAFTAGFKPGGTNLTYGYADDNAPPMVFETFEPESVEAFEFGLKTDLLDGRAIANIAAFSYTYEDLQFQATDPDPYRGGVANIPESEMSGVEVEFNGFLTDSLSLDVKMSFLDSEVTSDYEVLDNVDAYQYFFGEEDLRYALRENVKGNELAKTPGLTADVSMVYETSLPSGKAFTGIFQYTRRGDFQQRVNNNPLVDDIDKYTVFNLTASFEINSELDLDVMVLNASDEDGVNSSMTDVFGVAATGLELIPPRQIMTRLRYTF
jgi:iron complex outermembrane receptor protein